MTAGFNKKLPVKDRKFIRTTDSPSPCPRCGNHTLVTIDSRPASKQNAPALQRRVKGCTTCNHRFTTLEIPMDSFGISGTSKADFGEFLFREIKALIQRHTREDKE